ncbi:MAG: hypothetical protein IJB17_04765, partial [Oscillospiraceae bacterium]|nr:hypothetical protein [Oscillospiraceae bacterium]
KKTLKIKGLFRIETLQSPSQKSNRFLTAPFTQGGLWVRCKHVDKSEFTLKLTFGGCNLHTPMQYIFRREKVRLFAGGPSEYARDK